MDSSKWNKEFTRRFEQRKDELKWLYCELYNNDMQAYEWLCQSLYEYYKDRNTSLRAIDRKREKNPDWYHGNDLLGMMMYTDAFADNLHGVMDKLDYIKACGVNCLHLMPLLDCTKGKDDGGYAISDFRKVRSDLGTMEDLEKLTAQCHKDGISCCLDFVMNHTSEDHEWARAARNGDIEARKRYFFFSDWSIPMEYEKTVPQVFPTTAPGNFTWLSDCWQIVMTSFYPYQWDLNYGNCIVFNDMVGNMLYLANRGIDIIRLDAVPYIWKQLGTTCRNLPQVHSIVRMMRLICEIVCPGVLLLGEVVMEPTKVVPYFGTVEKPECHMLYNVTTMASTWNTIATKDTGLLKHQLGQVFALPKDYVFLNYLRCHDDIGWGLDYNWLKNFSVEEVSHKRFLNDYFTGRWPGSDARGELYNDDPRLGDARLCGTCASLSGLEAALFEKNEDKAKTAVNCILMLHAYLLTQSGIPMLYSGDEVGQLNDYSYKEDSYKQADSRFLHRGKFLWDKYEEDIPQTIFKTLRKMETLRAENEVFNARANVYLFETGNNQVLGICREYNGDRLVAYFNFGSSYIGVDQSVLGDRKGYINLMNGEEITGMEGIGNYEFYWLLKKGNK